MTKIRGINGEITIGSLLVHIDSALYQGLVVIHTVRFSGASFRDTWEVEMECAVK